jgi:hypothetical protein
MSYCRVVLVLGLAITGCGRLGFDARDAGGADATTVDSRIVGDSGGVDSGSEDSGTVGDAAPDAPMPPLVDLPGELATLPVGWGADVWNDFSDDYTYVDVQYLDVTYPMNNRPHHMALLSAPFEPGIALVGTWEIWEVRAPDVFVSHFYYPGSDDGPGPDALFDAAWCGAWMGSAPGLCVAAGSQNGGDGVYRVEADWSISRISSDNNVGDLAFDPTGAFDAIGAPTLYWSGPDGLRRFGESVFYPGMLNGAFTEILPSGDILTMNTNTSTDERRLVILESTSHDETVVDSNSDTTIPSVARQHAGVYAAVAGDVSRLAGFAYAIRETRDLLEIAADGSFTVIASAGEGWRWTHALVPPASHPLGSEAPVIYVLEFDPTREVNRIIRLFPSGR